MRIGITERGDAGIDFSWRKRLHRTDGRAILITKRLSENFISVLMEEKAVNNAMFILHATITGLGGTAFEPNVPTPEENLQMLKRILDANILPAESIVLRIDPIIPGYEGYAQVVLNRALELGILPQVRCKVSVLDMYPHVRERFQQAGIPVMQGFTASPQQFAVINQMLYDYSKLGIRFTTCNEPLLTAAEPAGCVGTEECRILHIPVPNSGINPQGRGNCLCLTACKTELLNNKRRCPHGCLYCYWKD